MQRRTKHRPRPTTWPREGLAKVTEAAAFLNVGRSTVYAAIKAGRLETVTVGTDHRIPWPALHTLARTPSR